MIAVPELCADGDGGTVDRQPRTARRNWRRSAVSTRKCGCQRARGRATPRTRGAGDTFRNARGASPRLRGRLAATAHFAPWIGRGFLRPLSHGTRGAGRNMKVSETGVCRRARRWGRRQRKPTAPAAAWRLVSPTPSPNCKRGNRGERGSSSLRIYRTRKRPTIRGRGRRRLLRFACTGKVPWRRRSQSLDCSPIPRSSPNSQAR